VNVTLSIDEETLAKAQELATRRGISLDQMLTEQLQELTSAPPQSPEETIQELRKLWAMNSGTSEPVRWTREEIHERTGIR
jgi:hypothetical protein